MVSALLTDRKHTCDTATPITIQAEWYSSHNRTAITHKQWFHWWLRSDKRTKLVLKLAPTQPLLQIVLPTRNPSPHRHNSEPYHLMPQIRLTVAIGLYVATPRGPSKPSSYLISWSISTNRRLWRMSALKQNPITSHIAQKCSLGHVTNEIK